MRGRDFACFRSIFSPALTRLILAAADVGAQCFGLALQARGLVFICLLHFVTILLAKVVRLWHKARLASGGTPATDSALP